MIHQKLHLIIRYKGSTCWKLISFQHIFLHHVNSKAMLSTLMDGFLSKHRDGKKFCWILVLNVHIRCLPPSLSSFSHSFLLPFLPQGYWSLYHRLEMWFFPSSSLCPAFSALSHTRFAQGTAILAEGLSCALWCAGWSITAFSFASPQGSFTLLLIKNKVRSSPACRGPTSALHFTVV